MNLSCPHCGATIHESSVDRQREIATCSSCQRLVDLRPQMTTAPSESASRPRMRLSVQLPAGMSIETRDPFGSGYRAAGGAGSVLITRRWLRGKHYVLLVLFLGLSVGAGYLWATGGFAVWLLFASVVLLSLDFQLLTMFVNTTRVEANRERIVVTHGPLPSLQGKNRTFASQDVKQLFAVRVGRIFAVAAHLANGSTVNLVSPLVSEEQALFVEQQLENALGITDYEVPGELAAAVPAPGGGLGRGSGVAGTVLAVLLPVLGIAFFFVLGNSEASGTLMARGEAGGWQFSPDDCSSGQRSGFQGVELSNDEDSSRVLRLVKDPVRGNLLIAEAAGAARPTVLADSTSCARFEYRFVRTSTTINDIVVVEGEAELDCPNVSGKVTFKGCH